MNASGPRAVYDAFWNLVNKVCQPVKDPGSGKRLIDRLESLIGYKSTATHEP